MRGRSIEEDLNGKILFPTDVLYIWNLPKAVVELDTDTALKRHSDICLNRQRHRRIWTWYRQVEVLYSGKKVSMDVVEGPTFVLQDSVSVNKIRNLVEIFPPEGKSGTRVYNYKDRNSH